MHKGEQRPSSLSLTVSLEEIVVFNAEVLAVINIHIVEFFLSKCSSTEQRGSKIASSVDLL